MSAWMFFLVLTHLVIGGLGLFSIAGIFQVPQLAEDAGWTHAGFSAAALLLSALMMLPVLIQAAAMLLAGMSFASFQSGQVTPAQLHAALAKLRGFFIAEIVVFVLISVLALVGLGVTATKPDGMGNPLEQFQQQSGLVR